MLWVFFVHQNTSGLLKKMLIAMWKLKPHHRTFHILLHFVWYFVTMYEHLAYTLNSSFIPLHDFVTSFFVHNTGLLSNTEFPSCWPISLCNIKNSHLSISSLILSEKPFKYSASDVLMVVDGRFCKLKL